MRTKKDYRQSSLSEHKQYNREHKKSKLTYTQFISIIETFNTKYYEYMLETGLPLKMMQGFGTWVITKRKPVVKDMVDFYGNVKHVDSRPIDHVSSKKYGKTIYFLNDHTNGYKYSYKWLKSGTLFSNKTIWSFKPFRVASRTLAHYLLNKPEISAKYSTWQEN